MKPAFFTKECDNICDNRQRSEFAKNIEKSSNKTVCS